MGKRSQYSACFHRLSTQDGDVHVEYIPVLINDILMYDCFTIFISGPNNLVSLKYVGQNSMKIHYYVIKSIIKGI